MIPKERDERNDICAVAAYAPLVAAGCLVGDMLHSPSRRGEGYWAY